MDPFCDLCFMFVSIILSCLILSALYSPAREGMTSWLSSVLCFLVFSSPPIWCLRSGVVLNSIDSGFLHSYLLLSSYS